MNQHLPRQTLAHEVLEATKGVLLSGCELVVAGSSQAGPPKLLEAKEKFHHCFHRENQFGGRVRHGLLLFSGCPLEVEVARLGMC